MFVSVIMPVYNGDEYLEASIMSILNQTYKEFELIIVNDGSIDRTKKILDLIDDPKVRIIHLESNQGVSAARNIAIENAKGDWIAVQDDDDISLPNRLEEQVKYLQTHQGVIAVCSLVEGISGKSEGDEMTVEDPGSYHNQFITRKQIEDARLGNCPVCCGTAMFSKKVFFEVGKYDTTIKIGEDYDLILLRMFDVGKVEVVPKVLYKYRADQKSVTRQNRIRASNLINVVSLKGIRRICYSYVLKKPSIVIIGTSTACTNFRENIAPLIDFEVYNYYERDSRKFMKEILNLIKSGRVQGVILLNNEFISYKKHLLRHQRMQFNKNLFVLYNIVK